MRVVIYAKSVPGKTAMSQKRDLRRHCQQKGWTNPKVYADPPGSQQKPGNWKTRLGLIKVLLGRKSKFDVICVWRIAMLGSFIDDLLWTLREVHVVRGIHIVAPGDEIDTTQNEALSKVLAALARVR